MESAPAIHYAHLDGVFENNHKLVRITGAQLEMGKKTALRRGVTGDESEKSPDLY